MSKQAYRPPAAQGKQASFKLHEEENAKKETSGESLIPNLKINDHLKLKFSFSIGEIHKLFSLSWGS